MRVLIAEDEALIRMDLREMLVEEGHEVVGEARDGAEAISLARDLTPDIVFMDVKMPGTDGIAAARAISEEGIAPVVMVTAFSQAGYVEDATEAGAMAYLVKPFSKRDIVKRGVETECRLQRSCLRVELPELWQSSIGLVEVVADLAIRSEHPTLTSVHSRHPGGSQQESPDLTRDQVHAGKAVLACLHVAVQKRRLSSIL